MAQLLRVNSGVALSSQDHTLKGSWGWGRKRQNAGQAASSGSAKGGLGRFTNGGTS